MLRVLLLLAMAGPAAAESLVATRTIRARTLVLPDDVVLVSTELPGALSDPAAAVGLEAKVAIYPGKPLHPGDLGPPTLVERNQTVTLIYLAGGLAILARCASCASSSEATLRWPWSRRA